MARATKRVCRDCGFMTPLAGALGARFGVCCNELSADGQVVDFFYGCGAHSDTPAPKGVGSPAFEPYDDGVLEVVEADRVTVEVEAAAVEETADEASADAETGAETDAETDAEIDAEPAPDGDAAAELTPEVEPVADPADEAEG
jgi:hypothetical protein